MSVALNKDQFFEPMQLVTNKKIQRQQFPCYIQAMNSTLAGINEANELTCYNFYDEQIQYGKYDETQYTWISVLRLCIILASSFALIMNIIVILRRKQYKFNTIRLFMFVQIFYVVSLLSVTTHQPSYNSAPHTKNSQDVSRTIDNMIELVIKHPDIKISEDEVRSRYFDCLVETGNNYPSAVEALINLTSYAIAYWLAVCITLYVRHVLENTHKNFMRKQGPFIFLVSLGILIWYLVPFCLTLVKGMPFSFGPTGYKFQSKSQLFFYGGLVNRSGGAGKALVIVWMLLLPMVLFAYHIYLLYFNNRAKNELLKLQEINPRQHFIIRSGRLSVVIFFVQFLNVGKLIFSILLDQLGNDEKSENPPPDPLNPNKDIHPAEVILLILNILFDLMAFVLIYIYCRHYYKEGRNLQERSEIMGSTLISSFSNPAI